MKIVELKYIYIIVFASLATWSFFAYFTMSAQINSQKNYAKIINLSGKQRMLSQKTTLIAKRFYESKDQKLKIHLKELIDLMRKDHTFIIKNLKSHESKTIYFKEPINLNKLVKNYLELLSLFYKTLDFKLLKKIENTSFELLPKLNDAVSLFEQESNKRTQELLKKEEFILIGTLLTLILEALIIVIPSIRKANRKEKELKELNKTLQDKIEFAIIENSKKDKLLEHQFHISQMTEMITNIAHQWRQPLSVISTIASGIKLEKELSDNHDKQTIEKLDSIIKKTSKLSATIDNFIDFLKQDTKKEQLLVLREIDKVLSILESTFKYHEINIQKKYGSGDILLTGNSSDLTQVLLNILSNSKDFLISRKIKNKWISINIFRESNFIKIEIEDNAGGIENFNLDKVFDIYFTTKHQSQGTGLGLFISYELIKKSFNGDIRVSNTQNGALFSVIIPINQS